VDIKNGDMFRQTSDGMDSVVKKIVTSHSTAVFATLFASMSRITLCGPEILPVVVPKTD
jgi:hypothetical protein